MEISKAAFRAHNTCKEDASFNDLYNKSHKLGNVRERAILIEIARDKNGICGDAKLIKLAKKDLIGTGHILE